MVVFEARKEAQGAKWRVHIMEWLGQAGLGGHAANDDTQGRGTYARDKRIGNSLPDSADLRLHRINMHKWRQDIGRRIVNHYWQLPGNGIDIAIGIIVEHVSPDIQCWLKIDERNITRVTLDRSGILEC
jgi:hypothetical protein